MKPIPQKPSRLRQFPSLGSMSIEHGGSDIGCASRILQKTKPGKIIPQAKIGAGARETVSVVARHFLRIGPFNYGGESRREACDSSCALHRLCNTLLGWCAPGP